MPERGDKIALPVPLEAFDRLMPLHLRVNPDGRITGYGPTLAKLLGRQGILGHGLFEAFEVRRPAGLTSIVLLQAHAGERLRLTLRHAPRPVAFRGLAMPLAEGAGMILNLSFGIGVVDAVRNFALTDGDFAATDLAVEMMYLVEAKTAAMETLRGFALRMQGDKQMAETQALTDTLTGLRNRRALAQLLERLTQSEAPFGLMHIDLDYFKAVNDTFGHAAGDHVLRWVADVLTGEARMTDIFARVGGDEFVGVFPDLTDVDRLTSTARRIIEALSRPILFEGRMCQISASIGITTSVNYAVPEIARMQHDADEALYASKRAGRGQAQAYPSGGVVRDSAALDDRRSA
ncbi:diguanylate cyclase [bacterium]|nr:diguanylate cyclase [bacterium]